mmetsp:Transcript_5110/g.5560  ORF Transcript_5110/g.5560 Transcript_5110/m.5560 type:complete len:349 (-) Transcript_5110:28-1074(-)
MLYYLLKLLFPVILYIVEKNMLPDFILRLGARTLIRAQLKGLNAVGVEKRMKQRQEFIDSVKVGPIAVMTKDANKQHYEVPAELFYLTLGPYLKYSSCIWPKGVKTLKQAEEAMLKQTCERANIQDGDKVLDIGCGWGSLTTYIATHFPNCDVTCVSNSNSQREFITEKCKTLGLNNVHPITCDINEFTTDERFDRAVSVEMFEHMKNYKKLMANIASWLNPKGTLFVHIFTHKEHVYHFTDGWMAENFFTGGTMPSDDLLIYFQEDLNIVKHWRVNGQHYEKTLNTWLKKMDSNKRAIWPILTNTYGKGNETKWWVNWRLFYIGCAETFGFDNGQEWLVSHYLFEKK